MKPPSVIFWVRLADLEGEGEKPELGIVNFDAHFDLRPYDSGSSSGSMFRQIADICSEKQMNYHYMPLGIQRHSNTIQLFKTAREIGVDYILAKEIQPSNYAAVLEKVDTFLYPCSSAYITVCTDVFSSAFAPGVKRDPVPGFGSGDGAAYHQTYPADTKGERV